MNALALMQRNSDEMFYNARGRLKRYALSCGYVEQYTHCSGSYIAYVTLSMQHGVLFVRAESETLYSGNDLQAARRAYDSHVRALKNTIR